MPAKPLRFKDRLWLRMFHKVTSGRASKEEAAELGVSPERNQAFYNARNSSRRDAMKRTVALKEPLTDFFDKCGDDPMDAMIEEIDRKKRQ